MRPDVKEYIDRLKDAVGRVWTPKAEHLMKEKDPDALCVCSDRRTVVEFTLDRSGSFSDVHVVKSSRVGFLDRLAVEAMREVGKVNDPPPSLFGDGEVTASLGFGFVLGIQGQLRPKSCT